MRSIRSHLTYANVVSTLCLVLLLGGGAYAADKLAKNSVGSKQIKANAVKDAELAKNAVTSPKVADGSLLGKDFGPDQLPQGPPGEPATRLFAVVNGTTGNLKNGSGAISASRSSTGTYAVSFDRSLTGCAVIATAGVGNPNVVGDVYQPGSTATVEVSAFTSSAVTVQTTGAGTAGAADRSFHVAAFC